MSSQRIEKEELLLLSKEELASKVCELQEQLAALRSSATSNSSVSKNTSNSPTSGNSTTPQHHKTGAILEQRRRAQSMQGPQKPYELSFSVLVIEGTTPTTMPLPAIVNKSYLRPDEREADTPVAVRQYSTDSAGSGVTGGWDPRGFSTDIPHRESSVESGMASSEFSFEQSPNSSPLVERKQQQQHAAEVAGRLALQLPGRPSSLDPNRLSRMESVGPDALLTNGTLQAFKNTYRGVEAQSPLNACARTIVNYLREKFVKQYDYGHNPDEVEAFGRQMISLCRDTESLLRQEPRHASTVSPVYVFGDIHGNFRDLHYFMTNLIEFDDLRYTPHRFMFLGDYVDRGEFSVEVVAFLFALKLLAPDKIVMLRGNHEDTLVSGDLGSYGSTSFRAQCRALFGAMIGEEVWQRASSAFAALPLTGNIDNRIFCTHGGLPRFHGGEDTRLDVLSRPDFPLYESFFQVPENETVEERQLREAATDTCWSDPAEDEGRLDEYGFGVNPRGNGIMVFGSAAVDEFLSRYGYEFIFRAHQEKSDGLKLSKNARVFTIFSTSAYVGHSNGAGVVLVADGKIRLIIKNPPE